MKVKSEGIASYEISNLLVLMVRGAIVYLICINHG